MRKLSVLFLSLAFLTAAKVVVSLDWDPSAIKEFEGRILEKRPIYSVMEANGKKYYLRIAPDSYLKRKGIVLDTGSKIWVKGMVVKVNNDYYVFAKEIKASGKKLVIRNDEGVPYWRIERRRMKGVRNNWNRFR